MPPLPIKPDHVPLAVVFVHGILGFDHVRLFRRRIWYFRKVGGQIRVPGVGVHFPALPPVGGLEDRARILGGFLDQIPADAIALIGHSMGGLDGRYAIRRYDPGHRIRFLATVATPHWGTPLARWLLEGRGASGWLSRRLMLPGLAELTPSRMRRFNDRVPDRADVVYHSYAGVRPVSEMAPWFRSWCRMIHDAHGDNDSQVAARSAAWGRFQGAVRADHLEMAGWNLALPRRSHERPFDHLALYEKIVATAVDVLTTGVDRNAASAPGSVEWKSS